jgi:hypothetical protein
MPLGDAKNSGQPPRLAEFKAGDRLLALLRGGSDSVHLLLVDLDLAFVIHLLAKVADEEFHSQVALLLKQLIADLSLSFLELFVRGLL